MVPAHCSLLQTEKPVLTLTRRNQGGNSELQGESQIVKMAASNLWCNSEDRESNPSFS